ncbi:collagen alpha-1(III) chain-like [Physella acuta]|uniref:collagen alpha-1(III) chain-like n=1 Tax=Physella acuta TaxID=109671 RepID=UPI0027DABB50|nr:collagen alpha-1(III) chain-like [Physella acuta]
MAPGAKWTECGLLLTLAFAASIYAAPSQEIKSGCSHNGIQYLHEDVWYPLDNDCLQCRCFDGEVKCNFVPCDKFSSAESRASTHAEGIEALQGQPGDKGPDGYPGRQGETVSSWFKTQSPTSV